MLIAHRDGTAIVGFGNDVSYDDLRQHIASYKAMLVPKKSARFAVYMENRPEWIYSFYAIINANATVVTIDCLVPTEDAAYILQDSDAQTVVCSRETYERTQKAVAGIKKPIKIICVDDIEDNWVSFPAEDIHEPEDIHNTAIIIYTSGTTGKPKGVMLSWDNILANVQSVSNDVPIYTSEQRVLLLLPLHHSFALSGCMCAPLYVGATVVFCTNLTGDGIKEVLQKYKVTLFIGVPRLYSLIRKGIRAKINAKPIAKLLFAFAGLLRSKGFSRKIFSAVHEAFGGHLDIMVSGGAALDYETAKDLTTLGFTVMEGYGMTEAGPMITCPRPGMVKIGTAGIPILHTEVRIVDGEIQARGRNIMKGYWNKPEETAVTLKDGWLHTGDLGEFDKEGFLRITGRKNELIVLPNGKNITADEIESKILTSTHGVADIGVYFEDNQLKAIVVLDAAYCEREGIVSIDEFVKWKVIDAYNRDAVPYKKILKYTAVRKELPRTRLGKLQRFLLPALGRNNDSTTHDIEEPDTEEYSALKRYIQTLTEKRVTPESHLELDLGLDSLDKVNVVVYIEKTFGFTMDDGVLSTHPTVGMLSEYITMNMTKVDDGLVDWHTILSEKSDESLPFSGLPHRIGMIFFKILFRIFFRLYSIGKEHIPQAPYLMIINHQSFLDWMVLAAVLHTDILKKTYIFAKEKHFRSPFRKWIARRSNVIIMDIDRDLVRSIKTMNTVISNGNVLAIFPEGTRSKDGTIGRFKKMFAILSKELRVPVLPIVLKGTIGAMKSGSSRINLFKKLFIRFLPPVIPDNSESYDEFAMRIEEMIRSEYKKM